MNWKRASIGVVIGAAVVALLAYGLTQDPRALPNALPGSIAPSFALPVMDAEGDTVRSADYKGKILVLNFWASWCVGCRDEHPILSELATLYRDKGVHFYGVLYDNEPKDARPWIEEMGGQTYPNLIDANSRVAIDYGLGGVPETIIIGPDGVVAHKQVGVVTRQQLTSRIDSILGTRTTLR